MFRPESPRSRFGNPNFILGWIASVDSEISIIDLLGGVDCRKRREKESKEKRTNPVHINYARGFDNYALIGISVGCNLAPLYSASAITSHIASYTDRGLDNFGWAEHPADLAEIASLVGFSLATVIEMLPDSGTTNAARESSISVNADLWVDRHGDCLYRYAFLRV
jgi:hypothetical protein